MVIKCWYVSKAVEVSGFIISKDIKVHTLWLKKYEYMVAAFLKGA